MLSLEFIFLTPLEIRGQTPDFSTPLTISIYG